MRNKWFLTCNCSDNRGFAACQLLSFSLACCILLVFGWLIFGSFARGSYGTLHRMFFALEGALSTFMTFLSLRKLLGVQSTKLSTGSAFAFFIILFIVSFVLWIFFFNGFPLSRIHSPTISLVFSLFIIVGAIALGCAWLRGCGWRILQKSAPFAPWSLLEFLTCVTLFGAVIGFTFRSRAIDNQLHLERAKENQLRNELISERKNDLVEAV